MSEQESELIDKGKTPSQSKDLLRLRSLVLGEDYEEVIQERVEKENIERVSEVISEALEQRNSQDETVINVISPIVESSIDSSIKKHPERITNVFFPIIGPLVRKAVASAISDLVHSLNYLLHQSLTARAVVWRYKAWRLGMPYGQYALLNTLHYQVEQIFLIHKDSGLLIQSVQAEGIDYQDPDLVSSMLSAITDFANDSFEQSTQGLETLQFGDLSLLIETGPYAVLAMAVRGTIQNEVKQNLSELNERIHARYSKRLRNFEGNTLKFESCITWLEGALVKKQKKDIKNRPWFAIFAISLLVMVLGYWLFAYYQTNRTIQHSIQIANQNGFQVINHKYENNRLYLDIIKSPSSVSETTLAEALNNVGLEYTLNEILVRQDLSQLYLPYLANKYKANLSFKTINSTQDIVISGEISEDNLEALSIDPIVVRQFKLEQAPQLVITPKLTDVQISRNELSDLIDEINSQFFYFEVASEYLTEISQNELRESVLKIKSAIGLQPKADAVITQIAVSGFADHQGSKSKNIELSEQRANYVKKILVKNDIDKDLIVSWGGGVRDLNSVPSEVQRRVKIEVFYSLNGVEKDAE